MNSANFFQNQMELKHSNVANTFVGKNSQCTKLTILVCICLLMNVVYGFCQTSANLSRLKGSWLGKIEAGTLRIVLKFDVRDSTVKVLLDSPDQGAKDIPLSNAQLRNDSVFIDAKVLGGRFSGIILPGDTLIDMILRQAGNSTSIRLHKLQGEFTLKRLQEPKAPFPYRVEDLVIENKKAGINLSATLTLPEGSKAVPVVILVSGSGPQNRNGEIAGHKPFLVIADFLTRNGIAVFRYDDRGTFRSTGNNLKATTFDFADDVEAIMDYLKQRPEINKKRIGIIGHSEGGAVASIVASHRPDAGFIVLLAAPGIPTLDFLTLQGKMIDKVMNTNPEKTESKLSLLRKEYELFLCEQSNKSKADSLKSRLIKEINELKYYSEKERQEELFYIDFPWYKTFLLLNPADYLNKVKCPVLALNGEKDLQISAKENLAGIAACLKEAKNKQYEIKSFVGLNHLFQHAPTGSPKEYGTIEESVAQEVLEYVHLWIKKIPN